jgi:hypothetical protein
MQKHQVDERRGDQPEWHPAEQRVVGAQRREDQARQSAGRQPHPKNIFERACASGRIR